MDGVARTEVGGKFRFGTMCTCLFEKVKVINFLKRERECMPRSCPHPPPGQGSETQDPPSRTRSPTLGTPPRLRGLGSRSLTCGSKHHHQFLVCHAGWCGKWGPRGLGAVGRGGSAMGTRVPPETTPRTHRVDAKGSRHRDPVRVSVFHLPRGAPGSRDLHDAALVGNG